MSIVEERTEQRPDASLDQLGIVQSTALVMGSIIGIGIF
ncbi:MAG: hypothetical protein JWR42_1277, partial [Marmoricola sp.]|nr:hypothetical protein [Marmoricola sp.]